jgi:hypothetical protein
MLSRLKDFLIGPPLPTNQLHEKKLNKIRALAAFSPPQPRLQQAIIDIPYHLKK